MERSSRASEIAPTTIELTIASRAEATQKAPSRTFRMRI